MTSSKKIHCVICNKKCSGNVLRYQDQYYHKQCFELEQSQGSTRHQQQDQARVGADSAAIPRDTIEELAKGGSKLQHSNLSSPAPSNGSLRSTSQQPAMRSSNLNINGQSSDFVERLPGGRLFGLGQTGGRSANNLPDAQTRSRTLMDSRKSSNSGNQPNGRSATLPHSNSSPLNGFQVNDQSTGGLSGQLTSCAGCSQAIKDGQALIALDLHWHVWCFKCTQCQVPLHGEYVAKEGKAYCERDYQKLFGVTCVYCKRYITGKVLQAGEAHHFHPSCARCSKCGDPFVPGEEMYLQGEVTWHPRCGPGPDPLGTADDLTGDPSTRSQLRVPRAQSPSLSSRSRSRSASPFSYMSRQYGRSSPGYPDSEAVGDLSRIYTISYLNADSTQGYLRRPIEPNPPKSPQFSRPTSAIRDTSRSSSRSQYYSRDRSVPRGMYSVLSSMRSTSSHRARSPSMLNEEAIQLSHYPAGQKPGPDAVPTIERDDFPAPPFPYHPDRQKTHGSSSQIASRSVDQVDSSNKQSPGDDDKLQPQQRASRPRSREVILDDEDSSGEDPQLRKEEEELSKIANGIGKIFLSTLREREKLRAWKRANLDPRNASRTPSATRELPTRLRYDNPTSASPSRDMDRPKPWDEEDSYDHSPTRTKSSIGRPSQMSSSQCGYKVVQANRSNPKPGYGLSNGSGVQVGSPEPIRASSNGLTSNGLSRHSTLSFDQRQRMTQNRSADLLGRSNQANNLQSDLGKTRSANLVSAHLRRSMPNVANLNHLHLDGPPKLYPYHLLVTSNYRLPPDVDRCHLERHLSNDEFQYLFHCDRLDFYRLPEWKRNELKRRAKLF